MTSDRPGVAAGPGRLTGVTSTSGGGQDLPPRHVVSDPRAPGVDVLLDAARQAATGLQQLLAFRHDCTTVTTPAGQATATARLTSAAAELGKAAEALRGLIELAEMTGRSGPTGKTDLN